MATDRRYEALKTGLEQLSSLQLWKVIHHPSEGMVYDTWNYEKETGRY